MSGCYSIAKTIIMCIVVDLRGPREIHAPRAILGSISPSPLRPVLRGGKKKSKNK